MSGNNELLVGLLLISGGIVISGEIASNSITSYTTNVNKEKLNEIVCNIESNNLDNIVDIESIGTLIINSKDNKAIIIANVSVNTETGIVPMKYTFSYNIDKQFSEFLNQYYSKNAYYKDVENLTLSSHEATSLLKTFANISKDTLIDYSPITQTQQEELQMYLNSYNSSTTIQPKSR